MSHDSVGEWPQRSGFPVALTGVSCMATAIRWLGLESLGDRNLLECPRCLLPSACGALVLVAWRLSPRSLPSSPQLPPVPVWPPFQQGLTSRTVFLLRTPQQQLPRPSLALRSRAGTVSQGRQQSQGHLEPGRREGTAGSLVWSHGALQRGKERCLQFHFPPHLTRIRLHSSLFSHHLTPN